MFKSIFKAVAVSAVAAVFSIGCGGGDGGNTTGPDDPNKGGGGKLTITGLPNNGDWGVLVARPGTDVSTFDAIDNTSEEDFVAVGYSTSNVFSLYSDNYYSLWTGSGSREVILINPQGDPDSPTNPVYYRATVNFSNGSATVPFSRFTAVTDNGGGRDLVDPNNPNNGGGGKLTITGLPSGTYLVWVFAAGADISTFDKFNNAIEAGYLEALGPSVSNNNVFDLFTEDAKPYTGSGSRKVYLQTGVQDRYATVNFSNGNATVPFSSFITAGMFDDDDNGGGGGDGTGGSFTLTGIPSKYNGKFAALSAITSDREILIGYQYTETEEYMTYSPITNGSVSLPMFVSKIEGVQKYSGNDTSPMVTIYIHNTNTSLSEESGIGYIRFLDVAFSNGSATKEWSDASMSVLGQ